MTANKQTAFRLTETAIHYLDAFGEQYNLNRTESIEQIIREHQKFDEAYLERIAGFFLKQFDEKYKNLFTGLRLASRNADQNSDILLELFNTLFTTYKIDTAYPTDLVRNPALESCRETVKERIAAAKQRKDNKTAKSAE